MKSHFHFDRFSVISSPAPITICSKSPHAPRAKMWCLSRLANKPFDPDNYWNQRKCINPHVVIAATKFIQIVLNSRRKFFIVPTIRKTTSSPSQLHTICLHTWPRIHQGLPREKLSSVSLLRLRLLSFPFKLDYWNEQNHLSIFFRLLFVRARISFSFLVVSLISSSFFLSLCLSVFRTNHSMIDEQRLAAPWETKDLAIFILTYIFTYIHTYIYIEIHTTFIHIGFSCPSKRTCLMLQYHSHD